MHVQSAMRGCKAVGQAAADHRSLPPPAFAKDAVTTLYDRVFKQIDPTYQTVAQSSASAQDVVESVEESIRCIDNFGNAMKHLLRKLKETEEEETLAKQLLIVSGLLRRRSKGEAVVDC